MTLETDLSPSSSPHVKSDGLHGRERVSPPNISQNHRIQWCALVSLMLQPYQGFLVCLTFNPSRVIWPYLSLCGWELSHFPPTNISTHFEDPLTSWLLPRKFFILLFSPVSIQLSSVFCFPVLNHCLQAVKTSVDKLAMLGVLILFQMWEVLLISIGVLFRLRF